MLTLKKSIAVVALMCATLHIMTLPVSAQQECEVLHVDINRDWEEFDPEDGSSWEDAFRFLQDALAEAEDLLDDPIDPADCVEIWVREGTYYPLAAFGPNSWIKLLNNVGIFGGFNGTETSRDQRRPLENITTLSGDFSGTPVAITVAAWNTDNTARLDGFHIIDGRKAIDFEESDAVISNCTIRDNIGSFFGAVEVYYQCNPQFINCTFTDNSGPAALHIEDSDATLVNCLLHNNSTRAIFTDYNTNVTVINCTIANNAGGQGAGGLKSSDTLNMSNTILWGNTGSGSLESRQIEAGTGSTTITYTTIQGLDVWSGSNNSGSDPKFVSPAQGNYRLQSDSPAIDAGNDSAVPED